MDSSGYRYTDIQNVENFPSFHDAELVGIEHAREDRVLELTFRRVTGELETLRFSGIIAQRMVDFAAQNVVSRLLISPRYAFSVVEIQTWIRWISSRDDSMASAIDKDEADAYASDFGAHRRMLFVLEPSCGAEVAVLCQAISLPGKNPPRLHTRPGRHSYMLP
jgi:hypothetical protein